MIEQVLQREGSKREMLKNRGQEHMRLIGHVMRQHQKKNLCLPGKVKGRGKGRPRTKFMHNLAKFIGRGNSLASLLQNTSERLEWCLTVAPVHGNTALR